MSILEYQERLEALSERAADFGLTVYVAVDDNDDIILIDNERKIICDGDIDDCEEHIDALELELKEALANFRARAQKLGLQVADTGDDRPYIVVDAKSNNVVAKSLDLDGVEKLLANLEQSGSDQTNLANF